jgi:Uma2 family endonuclease
MDLETHATETEYKFYEDCLLDDMPESQPQIDLYDYVSDVLKYQYISEQCFITGNLAIYPPDDKTYPFRYIAPDVAVFKGVTLTERERSRLNSWRMVLKNRPAPDVVFEIASEDTWQQDLDPKPENYRLLGVKEYFACDPQSYWPNHPTGLRGWRYPNGNIEEIQPDEHGRLWSNELDSWLVMEGLYLRFYDRDGNLRLTKAEARERQAEEERIAKEEALYQIEVALRQAEQARQQAELEREALEAQQAAKEEALRQAEAERIAKEEALRQAEAERAELQALLEKLRKNQIDPDKL